MIGFGTILNTISIVAGGLIGHVTGKLFRREQQDALNLACGISVLFIAMAIVGAIQDGLLGDYSTLAVKSVLDCIIVAVMTSSTLLRASAFAMPIKGQR